MRRGVEPHPSGARARDPTPVRGCRVGLHPDQHLRRVAHHAEPPRAGGQDRGDQPAAVAIAREAFQGRPGYVIGDIGPFGGLLEPFGDFREDDVRAAFEEQAHALVEAGADAIIIETQTSLEELLLGIRAAQRAGAACVIGSMAYDVTRDGSTFRTMMGVDPERAAKFIEENGADIVALNCGTGMDMERALAAVQRYRQVTSLPVMVQPNAGQPKLVNMQVTYDETPEHMSRGVVPLLDAGVPSSGACCGSTPEHIRAFRKAMDAYLHGRTRGDRMKTKLCDLNPAAAENLPQFTGDKSGIGVHYIDAYIKPMNTKLPDGTPVQVQTPRPARSPSPPARGKATG